MTADKAGRWLRVSTKAQDEANQEPDIDQWIADHGYDLAETYVLHGKSAYKGKQDAMLDQVIADMEAGKINVLVVWQSSRIERRGAYSAFDLARRVRDAGGRIEYVKDAYLNEANDMSDVMLALAATKDKKESQDKSERVRAAHDRARAEGGAIGRAAFGWQVTGEDRYRKRFEVFEPEARITREMVRRYLAGESLAGLERDFERRGITAKHGARWTTKTLAQYLHRPVLYGSRAGKHGVISVEPIIDFATWQAVQDRLAARRKNTGGHGVPGLLSGTLYCGKCGHRAYLTNAGYYCRTCPVGQRMLIPREIEQAVIAEVAQVSEPETVTDRPADDRQERIDRLSADIQRMNPAATPDYLATVTAKLAEINEIKASLERTPRLPVIPRKTGRTLGMAFVALPDAERRQFLLDHVRFTARETDDGWQLAMVVLLPWTDQGDVWRDVPMTVTYRRAEPDSMEND